MAWLAIGLSVKSNHYRPFVGITDDETVMLDLDNCTFKQAQALGLRIMQWHKLGGLALLRSSKGHYHLIFDRRVDWSENIKVVAWAALVSHNAGLNKWLIMQCIKQASTLRIQPKRNKPAPRLVYKYGSQQQQIKAFLEFRTMVRKIVKQIGGTHYGSS